MEINKSKNSKYMICAGEINKLFKVFEKKMKKEIDEMRKEIIFPLLKEYMEERELKENTHNTAND